uniref:coiled-coil domain-containing protein 7 isoform X3 n=1 Tax=Myodes glareolus TaxID=447135 RepID=UPI002021849D|nr:coiled-coil domain-containing protein 7 isoform X3 [Myodes glareolus]
MKRAQPLSTINKKLTSVPELPYKKGLLNSTPKPKEKRNAKSQYEKIEPMVLRSPPTGESIVRYALPIPSSKTKDLIAEDEMVRKITKHLKMVVSALEDTYGTVDEDGEQILTKPKDEGVSLSLGADMNAFLLCCSQFAAQMEEAVKEERNILESLFKWFQQQVNQMEEIGKDQSILEGDFPTDDKTLKLNIAQIANLLHRVEDLKTRLRGRKGSLMFKQMEKDTLPGSAKSYEAIENQIEEFIKTHSVYESQVASETEPEAPYSVTTRMKMMMRIFENQTNMLEKALNDQSIVETKYKQMETDFQMLLLEKTLLEKEIQRMKEPEKAKPTSKEDRAKKFTRPEKKKDKDSERKLSPTKEMELVQIQKEAEALKMEKKALQEQLKWALQEAERNKNQLEYILHHEMEVLKEEQSKTKVERGLSRSRSGREDSKHSLFVEKDAQLGGQQQIYDQVPPEKSKSLEKTDTSAPVVDPLEGYGGVPGVPAFPPEIFKSFTAMPLIEEYLESDSPPPKETEMWSLVSFPNLAEEMEKAEVSEHVLSHTEAEQVEVSYKMSSEIPAPENLLQEAQVTTVKQLYGQGRRKPLFITAKPPEHLSLISRTQSEIENLEATRYENVINDYEEQDKKFGSEDSVADIKPKQKSSKTERLYTHEEESERMVYEEAAKAKVSAKKPDASKGKELAPHEADDGALSPESQGSVSKGDEQTKKQRIYKRERLPVSHEVPDKSFEHQDNELKFEIQAKKLKFFKPESVQSEVSDKNIKLEDQKAQSSSQVQLKKQKSLGGEIFTIHFAVPDDISAHLHQESSLKFQAQAERGTTSEDARFSPVPVEYQKKDVSVDNIFPEKKLLITRSPTQIKKYASPQEESAESENVIRVFTNEDLKLQSMDQVGQKAETKSVTDFQKTSEPLKTLNPIISEIIFRLDMDKVVENDLQNLKEAFERHLLKSEFKARSKTGLELKGIPSRSQPKEPLKMGLRKQDDDLNIIKGTKLLATLRDQHNMSFSPREDITPGVSSMKTKPQENVNAKYHPPKTFPTKVINLLPFTNQEENVENSTPYENVIPKPFYRTSRGSSGLPTTFQQLLNRRTSGAPKQQDVNKPKTELENQMHILVTSPKKYLHKGTSKTRKLRKKGAESRSNLRTSTSSTKKQKLKEQHNPVTSFERSDELPNNMKTLDSIPKIKVLKELSKTSLSNNLRKSRSAAKKLGTEEQPVNLNDEDAIVYYNLRGSTSATNKHLTAELSKTTHFYDEVSQRSSAVYMSMSAIRKRKTKETSKTTNLEKGYDEVETDLQIPNLAATINELKEPRKPSDLDENAGEETNLLHMSTSTLMRYLLKESSKTSSFKKQVVKGSSLLHKSTSSVKKHLHKDKSKTKTLGKNVGEGTSMLRTSATAKKKRVLGDPSETRTLEMQMIKGTSILRKSASASRKRGPKGLSKPTKIGGKGTQLPSSLHISNLTSKKNVLKGQPKPTTLDKKGVNRLNNLVPSTPASSKGGLKEQNKSVNVDKKVADGPYSLNTSTSSIKKQMPKGQLKPTTLNKKGVDLLNNLVPLTSISSKGGLKGQPKFEKSDEKNFKLLDNSQPSASVTRKHLLKELSTIL